MMAVHEGPQGEISEHALEVVTARLRVLADPARVRVLWQLEERGPCTVTQLCVALGRKQQTVSKSLAVLYSSGFVTRDRDGNSMRYTLADYSGLAIVRMMFESASAHVEEQHERLTDL